MKFAGKTAVSLWVVETAAEQKTVTGTVDVAELTTAVKNVESEEIEDETVVQCVQETAWKTAEGKAEKNADSAKVTVAEIAAEE